MSELRKLLRNDETERNQSGILFLIQFLWGKIRSGDITSSTGTELARGISKDSEAEFKRLGEP